MVAALAITPASGSITAKSSVCRIDVTGANVNTTTGYNANAYPQMPAIRYYILVDAPAGTDDGKSYIFTPGADGSHSFYGYTFPIAGSYTIRLRDSRDDSDAATLAVTVS